MIRTDITYEEAMALPDPKSITLGPNIVIVDTSPPKEVPEMVSSYQARIALHNAGLLEQLEAYMLNTPIDLKIRFEFSEPWYRNSPHILEVVTALGWSSEMVDNLFIAASKV